jgi:dienelactone hydrolase
MAPRFALLAVLASLTLAAPARAVPSQAIDCQAPAGEATPGTQAWDDRDRANMACATERLDDEYGNPAFGYVFNTETPGKYADQNVDMLLDPAHPHLTLGQLVPGGSTTDPFRTINRWTAAGRGEVEDISFTATNGAQLNGHIFLPPDGVRGRLPGVVITTGSIQGYQEMYYWAAEGLAEAGYEVMTYDVQGQGNSDTFPAMENCTGPDACSGVPFQQAYNFYQGTIDALNFFFSDANPGRGRLDPGRVGLAGHSLGASAVSTVAQCDRRVKAVVAWDNLGAAQETCTGGGLSGYPTGTPETPRNDVPGLGLSAEYFFNPQPQDGAPVQRATGPGPRAQRHAGADDVLRRALGHVRGFAHGDGEDDVPPRDGHEVVLGARPVVVEDLDGDVGQRDEVPLGRVEQVGYAAAVAVAGEGHGPRDAVTVRLDEDSFLALLHT